ncbi:hypothetical protein EV360DRAFT_13609, partial [Lentinula raphanica]
LHLAQNPTSSRVLDVLLDSPTVPTKAKRSFVLSFIGTYHLLVDDRIGSRVGERCFAFADTYLKEKIARSVLPHEQTLAASFYGKFFARKLDLYLLKRRPEEWKTGQVRKARKKANMIPSTTFTTFTTSTDPPSFTSSKKRKREDRVKDEIDELFDAA